VFCRGFLCREREMVSALGEEVGERVREAAGAEEAFQPIDQDVAEEKERRARRVEARPHVGRGAFSLKIDYCMIVCISAILEGTCMNLVVLIL